MGAVGWRAIRQIAQQVPGAEVRHGERMITLPGGGTVQVRSADDPQSLRGEGLDYAVLDECAYMREEAWTEALRPALSDRRGGALFISTPHGLNWFRRLWQLGQSSEFDDWESWTFKTLDNPFIAADEVESARRTLLGRIFRQEYEADFLEDNPGALWRRDWIDARRVLQAPDLARVVVAVDPTATTGGDECGIIGAGMAVVGGHPHLYVLADASRYGSPREWASAVCTLYREIGADLVVAEANNGGEMVQFTLQTIDPGVRVKLVHASRGKATRAEPISAVYEQGRAHHVGTFAKLEDELCQWEPGDASPNRLDALVWAGTELVLGSNASAVGVQIDGVRLHKLGERRSRW
jgi:phage terminase large subunit-like protein